jgi:hypothetical protein
MGDDDTVRTVAHLREVLADVPGDVATGPYMIEYSPSDHRLDVHEIDETGSA